MKQILQQPPKKRFTLKDKLHLIAATLRNHKDVKQIADNIDRWATQL